MADRFYDASTYLMEVTKSKYSWIFLFATCFPQLNSMVLDFYNQHGIDLENAIMCNSVDKNAKMLGEKFLDEICLENNSYKVLYDVLKALTKKCEIITVGVEQLYIDRFHRDTYYSHYSEKHIEISRYCKRLILFCGRITKPAEKSSKDLQEKFIGSMIIRPLTQGAIGRTLLNPYYIFPIGIDYYVRTAIWDLWFLGKHLKVKAFPFLTQDRVTTTCAETTILVTMDYYSKKYVDYRFVVPSDIIAVAENENCARVLPSSGLSYQTISKALCTFGLYTQVTVLGKRNDTSISRLKSMLYYYVESGMPVCVGLSTGENQRHAVVFIGHEEVSLERMLDSKLGYAGGCYFVSTALGCRSYVTMDDNVAPYSVYSFTDDCEENEYITCMECDKRPASPLSIDCFIAPLHKRMYMDAKRAEGVVLSVIKEQGLNPCNFSAAQKSNWGSRDNPLIYRLFLASTRHLKEWRMQQSNISDLFRTDYLSTPLPQFVWVCEFYDKVGYKAREVNGEILIDATMCPLQMMDSILMMNYTNGSCYFSRDVTGKSRYRTVDNVTKCGLMRLPIDPFKMESYSMNLTKVNSDKMLTVE